MWRGDPTILTSSCRCGWANPRLGPPFPDLPPKRQLLWKELIEAPEREHSREYHVAVWAQHTADALGDPSTLDAFQDPDLTPNSLAQGLIFALRLLLDEDPRRVRRITRPSSLPCATHASAGHRAMTASRTRTRSLRRGGKRYPRTSRWDCGG